MQFYFISSNRVDFKKTYFSVLNAIALRRSYKVENSSNLIQSQMNKVALTALFYAPLRYVTCRRPPAC